MKHPLASDLRASSAKPSEAEKGVEKRKKGTQRGHKTAERLAKTSADYWKAKVRPRVIRGTPTPEFYVRLKEAGRDAWVCLDTANRTTAAGKARDHWVRMRAVGLPALLAELAPEKKPDRVATVGEAIAAASKLSTVRPGSFAGYAQRLRQLGSEIAKAKRIGRKATKVEIRKWREAADAVSLSVFTADRVNAWKVARIAAEKADPQKRRRAEVTASAIVRLARSVFSKDVLAAGLGKALKLPDPLPFHGVTYGPSTRRFVASVDPGHLFAAARVELEKQQPQQFLAFTLCLLAGLRRSEADTLTWEQVDLDAAVVRVRLTAYFEPKSAEATREVELDAPAVEILRRAKADNPDPIFVLRGGPHRPQTGANKTYRADAAPHRTWEGLSTWLHKKGVREAMPIHTLRKLAGSLVFEAHGIEQARGFLGHGDVGTTSRSYLAKTKRVVVSLTPPADEVEAARRRAEGGTP